MQSYIVFLPFHVILDCFKESSERARSVTVEQNEIGIVVKLCQKKWDRFEISESYVFHDERQDWVIGLGNHPGNDLVDVSSAGLNEVSRNLLKKNNTDASKDSWDISMTLDTF